MISVASKIFIAVSLFLNAILLAFLFGPLPLLLYLSALANILLMWYIRRVLQTIDELQEDVLDIFGKLEKFSDHLDKIHDMEMFYGDSSLQDLINHSRRLMNDIVDVEEKYYDHEDIDEDTEEDDLEDDPEEAPQEDEEPVLYQRS